MVGSRVSFQLRSLIISESDVGKIWGRRKGKARTRDRGVAQLGHAYIRAKGFVEAVILVPLHFPKRVDHNRMDLQTHKGSMKTSNS